MSLPLDVSSWVHPIIDAVVAVQGRPFSELRDELGTSPVENDKALGHRVAELVLARGGAIDPSATLRTIPLRADGMVREPTKLCRLDFEATAYAPFELSELARTVREILFLPIMKRDVRIPAEWCFETPFVWGPSVNETLQIREDYEQIQRLIARGDGDALTSSRKAGYGRIVMPKTSGRNRLDVDRYRIGSHAYSARKRAFFLRSDHTQTLILRSRAPHQRSADVGIPRADHAEIEAVIGRLL